MSDFQGFSVAAFGVNGVGKTTACLKFVLALYKKGLVNAVLCLVADLDEEDLQGYRVITPEQVAGIKKGVFVLPVDDPEAVFSVLFEDIPPYLAVFIDDAGAIMPVRVPIVHKFLKRRRQKKCHLVMNYHGASDMPRALFMNVGEYWIFKTADSTKAIANRVMDRKHFEATVSWVNDVANKKNKYFFVRYDPTNPPKIPDAYLKR